MNQSGHLALTLFYNCKKIIYRHVTVVGSHLVYQYKAILVAILDFNIKGDSRIINNGKNEIFGPKNLAIDTEITGVGAVEE